VEVYLYSYSPWPLQDEQGASGGASATSACGKQQYESNTSRQINYEQQLLDILKEKSEHTDEDKTSFLSFTKLNDDHQYWAKMKMLGIMRKAKNMVFQPQYAQDFTATTSLPQT
jgi:hypothetical protein